MERKELERLLERKHVLLDTNILIGALDNPNAFSDLFRFLLDSRCDVASFSFIEFEFLSGAFAPEHKKKRRELIKEVVSSQLQEPRTDLINEALEISVVYAQLRKRFKYISDKTDLVDYCIAAYLKRHSENLFLVTMNHKDFPPFLFERLDIHTIDVGNDILTPAFYKFRQNEWQELKDDLDGSHKA